jgi:hypothetical protein
VAKTEDTARLRSRRYWADQIARAKKRYHRLHTSGITVEDTYRIEAANTAARQFSGQDKFNILYSSTETIKPSLYANTPKVEVEKTHKDRTNPLVEMAVAIQEAATSYAVKEVDFDNIIENCVIDYLLPGLSTVWVRYEAAFKAAPKQEQPPEVSTPEGSDTENPDEIAQVVDYENVALDYVHWRDILYGPARVWQELPWAARRVYKDRKEATARFGKAIASKLSYSINRREERSSDEQLESAQCEIWEIWDLDSKSVIWYADSYEEGLLDQKKDPYRLKNFFPTPRPLRAITTTRTLVPRPFYSQYQAQQDHINVLTKRIRMLTEALRVTGVYDRSSAELGRLLDNSEGNKMIGVDNWAMFAQAGGIQGTVIWLPIKDVASVLMELLKARQVCKDEIYEITGFSDIVRGVSKASETLGAQNIKTDWASARLRVMQKEVQRFCADIIRLMAELVR